jgi:hypothetical protein
LRRYLAGHTLLDHFLTEEIEGGGPLLAGTSLKSLLGSQAALLDQLLAAVSKEYDVETRSRLDTSDRRRAERVGRLLNGELVDTSELAYDFEISHLGVIATGPGAAKAIRGLASASDCGLLLVPRGEQTVWAWLGTRRPIDPDHVERHISSDWPAQLTLALGEPAKGFTGWRRTHMQAKASLSIALRSPLGYARYGDVPLLASAFQDDLLAASLHELYLVPLELEPNGGRTSLETLRAYIAAGRKVSPAAAALGLNRRTVAYRLHAIETRLGRPLGSFMAEIEVALKLQDLSDIPSSPGRTSQSN